MGFTPAAMERCDSFSLITYLSGVSREVENHRLIQMGLFSLPFD